MSVKSAAIERRSLVSDSVKKDEILHDHNHDGIDRRGFLKCMAWAGTGALCVIQGGVLKSYSLSRPSEIFRRSEEILSDRCRWGEAGVGREKVGRRARRP